MLDLIATSTFGLEAVVTRELAALGYDAKPTQTGRIAFEGDEAAICHANLWLRAADRVQVRIGAFDAPDFEALFEQTRDLPWEEWIGPDGAFPVAGRSVKSKLSSVPACQRAVKRAIADRLMRCHGTEHLDESGPAYQVEIALLKDRATLTIDASGAGLHKRGYRTSTARGQLRETLAAGLVQLSFWRPERPFIDPFCGTGTIPIEAALIATNTAPGLRRTFVSEDWPRIGAELWERTRADARSRIKPAPDERLVATDISEDALRLARHHAGNAGVEEMIHFQQRDFADLRTKRTHGCIIANPPYGHQLGDRDETTELYRSFPDVLRRLPTWSHFIFTGHPHFEKIVGQEADRRRKLYNAQIECNYFQFHGPPPGRTDAPPRAPQTEPTTSETPTQPDRMQPVFGGLDEHVDTQAELFRNCLARRVRHLRKWPSRGIECYRLYDRNVPEVPLVVDRYGDHLHIAEHDRPHEHTKAQHLEWLERMAREAAETAGVPVSHVHLKKRGRQRGLTQYERVDDVGERLIVQEGGLSFEVNLDDYIDTGLFLDHRITRSMVRDQAKDARFLNLFCYTGSFTVYAAAGGAAETTSVDLSNTYLDWARRNLSLNRFNDANHEFVRTDVLDFLRDEAASSRTYDLIVADPPTFSNSKRTDEDWDIQASHGELLSLLARVLSPDGTVFFSTNFRKFQMDEASLEGLSVQEISHRTVPEDFRNKRIHRCWRIRHT